MLNSTGQFCAPTLFFHRFRSGIDGILHLPSVSYGRILLISPFGLFSMILKDPHFSINRFSSFGSSLSGRMGLF